MSQFVIFFLQILDKNRNTYQLPKHHSSTVSKRLMKASSGMYWLQLETRKVYSKPPKFIITNGMVSHGFMYHRLGWLKIRIHCCALLWFCMLWFLMQNHRRRLKLRKETPFLTYCLKCTIALHDVTATRNTVLCALVTLYRCI